MTWKEYHAAINKLATDSLNVVCTSGPNVWDANAMICGLDTIYGEDATLVLRIHDSSIRLYEEDVQGFIQYLNTILPLFKERAIVTAAHNERMKLEDKED